MKILKKSKSKNTKMDDMWLDSAGIKHFWMKWRYKFLLKQLKKNNISINNKLKIMDLGCGNGILSNQLESQFNIRIDRVDANEETLLLNKKIKGKLICYNVNTKSKKVKNYYDIIFLFDVLEHVKKDVNFLKNTTTFNFDDKNYFSFNTRRNRKINLTEYYDLVYEYKNDCLTAGVKYKKTYYEDRDLKPTEDLLFTITLFPITQYQQKIDQSLYRD